MPRTRRLEGIAALSAGALASAGLTSPVLAADAAGDEMERAALPEAIPGEVLGRWEAERGVDLPDALFIKVEDPGLAPGSGDAFVKWEYRPGGDDADPALIKFEYTGDSDEPFLKVEYGLDSPEGQAALRDLGGAFLKLDGVDAATPGDDPFLKLEGVDADTPAEDLFHKVEGIAAGPGTGDGFLKWDFAVDEAAVDDAFYKLEIVGSEPDGSVAFHKWGYDALEVIEDALTESVEASMEGDPDRPLATVLDEVRALRSVAPAVNPFVERDRAMQGLPVPKRLPADAGSYAAPRAGIWRSVNLPARLDCTSGSRRLPRTVEKAVRLKLEDGGARIVARNLGGDGSQVELQADPALTGRYLGTVSRKERGGRVDMDVTLQLVTDARAVGSIEVVTKAGGETCTLTRGFDMTFKGR